MVQVGGCTIVCGVAGGGEGGCSAHDRMWCSPCMAPCAAPRGVATGLCMPSSHAPSPRRFYPQQQQGQGEQQQGEQQPQGQPHLQAASSSNPSATPSAATTQQPGSGPALPRAAPAARPPCPHAPALTEVAPEAALALGWGPADGAAALLHVQLLQPGPLAYVCAKLIGGEDMQPAFNASRGGCNIDCTALLLRGKQAALAGGVAFV